MWIEGKPGVDDDLMEDWLRAVIKAMRRGITGETLRTTTTELVDHLSSGKRRVVLVDTPAPQDGGPDAP